MTATAVLYPYKVMLQRLLVWDSHRDYVSLPHCMSCYNKSWFVTVVGVLCAYNIVGHVTKVTSLGQSHGLCIFTTLYVMLQQVPVCDSGGGFVCLQHCRSYYNSY